MLQHSAGRLPGVLVTLPGVDPAPTPPTPKITRQLHKRLRSFYSEMSVQEVWRSPDPVRGLHGQLTHGETMSAGHQALQAHRGSQMCSMNEEGGAVSVVVGAVVRVSSDHSTNPLGLLCFTHDLRSPPPAPADGAPPLLVNSCSYMLLLK